MNPAQMGPQPSRSVSLEKCLAERAFRPKHGLWGDNPPRKPTENVAIDNRLPQNRPQARAGRRIEAAVNYMLQHLDESLDMSELSKLLGLSSSTFYLLFKRITGHTPNDFFIRARMQRACELLHQSECRIKEVAAMLGYQDQFYFSRLFKSVVGISPKKYQASLIQGNSLPQPVVYSCNSFAFSLIQLGGAAAPTAGEKSI